MQAKMLRNLLSLLPFFSFLTPCTCRAVNQSGEREQTCTNLSMPHLLCCCLVGNCQSGHLCCIDCCQDAASTLHKLHMTLLDSSKWHDYSKAKHGSSLSKCQG